MLRPGSHHTHLDERTRERTLSRYVRTRDPRDLEALVGSYRPLARSLARRYAAASAGPEDLEQVAYEGLIKALQRFEPDRGAAFTTFAVPTILGELRRYLRDTAWPAHVARSLQERVRAVNAAADHLSASDGQTPTVGVLAEELGWDHETVVEALGVSSSLAVVSLDARDRDGLADVPLADRIGDDDPGYDRVDCLTAIEDALPGLDRSQKAVLRLHFGEDLTQRQIALRLRVSRATVARSLAGAVASLRAAAAAEPAT